MGEWRSSGGRKYYRKTGSGFSSGGQNCNVSNGSSSSSSSSGGGSSTPKSESTAERNQRLLTEGMQKVNESPEAYQQWRSQTIQKYGGSSSGSSSVQVNVLNKTDSTNRSLQATTTPVQEPEQKTTLSSTYLQAGREARRQNTLQSQAPIYERPSKREEKKAPIYSKDNLSKTGYEERVLRQIKRESEGSQRVDALTTSIGIGRNKNKSAWNPKEIGKTIARQGFEIGKGLSVVGGRVGLAVEGAFHKEGRKELASAIKKVPGAVGRTYYSKEGFTPQNLINIGFTVVAVKGVGNARANARASQGKVQIKVKSTTTAKAIKDTKGQTSGYKVQSKGTITRGKQTAQLQRDVVSKGYGNKVVQQGRTMVKQGSKLKQYKTTSISSKRGLSKTGLEQTKGATSYELLKQRPKLKVSIDKGNLRLNVKKVATKPTGKVKHSAQDTYSVLPKNVKGITKGKHPMTIEGGSKPLPAQKPFIKSQSTYTYKPIKKPSSVRISSTGKGLNRNVRIQVKKPGLLGKKGQQSISRGSDLTGNRFQSTGLERAKPIFKSSGSSVAKPSPSFNNFNSLNPNLTGLGGLLGKSQAGFIVPVVPVSNVRSGARSISRSGNQAGTKAYSGIDSKPDQIPKPDVPAIGKVRPVPDTGVNTIYRTESITKPGETVNIINEPPPPPPPIVPPGLIPFAFAPIGIGGLSTFGGRGRGKGARTKKKSAYTFSLEAYDKGIFVKSFKQLSKKQKKITPGVLRPVIKGRGLIG